MKLNKLQLALATLTLSASISASATTLPPLPHKGTTTGKAETISINGGKATTFNTLNTTTNAWSTVSSYTSNFGTIALHSSAAETVANLPYPGILDSLFTVGGKAGQNVTAELSFSGAVGTAQLFDKTTGNTAITLKLINGEYIAYGLKVGDTYDYKLSTTSGTSSFTAGVSLVPEPEEFALMLGGLAMLAVRLRNDKKA